MPSLNRLVLFPLLAALALASSGAALAQNFETMAQPVEAEDGCKAPRPPKDLAETAYIRNGYRAILRIMTAEKWQETGECDCFIAEFTWEDVVDAGEKHVTSTDPKRPFDTSQLRIQADELEAAREKACLQ